MLNEQQQRAVECYDKPALVLAGAGSGKTTVLINKLEFLNVEKGIHPSRILALTFSNKAAKEMRERAAEKVTHPDRYQLELSTFHSFCLKLLKIESNRTKFASPDFKLYDSDNVQSVIKQIVKEMGWQHTKRNSGDFVNTKNVANYISYLKNEMVDADTFINETQANEYQDWKRVLSFIEGFDFEVLQRVQKIYKEYERKMKLMNAMDFDDLLYNATRMLMEEEEIRKKYVQRYEYVMVDEFQDTNRVQYVFTYLLTKDRRKLTVVADDYQSIYAFRGSDIRNILDFDKDYPDVTEIKLEQNYRSTKKIIEAANDIIKNNINQRHKTLFTENEEGENLKLYAATNEYNEASFVAEEIESLIYSSEYQYKDIAILFRNNRKSALVENALNSALIPNRVVSGLSFFQRREIKDILYYLRFLMDPNDPVFMREIINIPKRGVGDTTIEKIIALSADKKLYDILEDPSEIKRLNAKTKEGIEEFWKFIRKNRSMIGNESLSSMVQKMIEELDLVKKHYANEERAKRNERQENLDQLVILIKEKERQNPNLTLRDFVEEMTLFPTPENEEDGFVQLMTMHASKGLEFPVVFLVGMDGDTFPSQRSVTEAELEEERRLAYVAFTRAKKLLYLTYPEETYVRGKNGFKESRSNSASPYIFEFNKKILSRIKQHYI